MKCLVDNNLPPALAKALGVLSASQFPDLEQVIALREKFPPETADIALLDELWFPSNDEIPPDPPFSKGGAALAAGGFCSFPQLRSDGYMTWIQALGQESNWFILSADQFRKHGDLERKALRQSKLIVFCLSKQWSDQPYWEKCAHRHQHPKPILNPLFRALCRQNHEQRRDRALAATQPSGD